MKINTAPLGFLAFGLVDLLATHFQIQRAGHVQHAVAHDFRVEPLRAVAPQILVLRILLQIFPVCVDRRHLVGLGGHDQFVHGLDAPFPANKLGGQPIQKFGMRWA